MNITQLRHFQAVCTFQSVSHAAQFLHISQPSLSSAIKELESEFGVVLFRRHHRGMTLTEEGQTLLKMASQILGTMDRTEELMKSLGKERRYLRLGIPPMIGSLILPEIYRSFLGENPDIHLQITEGGHRELMEKLREDQLDMVIISHSGPLEQTFSSQPMARLPIDFCTAGEIPEGERATPQLVAQGPLVLFEDSFFQTEKIKKWFSDCGISPNIILQTKQLSTLQSIISHKIAAGFLFRRLAEADPRITAIPTEPPLQVEVSLVWRRESHLSYGMERFAAFLRKNNLF